MNYVLISSLIILILIILFSSSRIERFQTSITPEERGLVFGYLDEKDKITKPIPPTRTISKNIKSNDIIELFSKDQYLGFSNKNPLFPNFLNRLGTFTPYIYEKVKILSKNNEPIIYNKTPVSFSITYLHEDYYLQYLSNTNTFYLTNNPSYFLLMSAMNNNNSEVLYDDSILIKCLDNSEYLLIYDNFIVTEANKSSSFFIKRSEHEEKCMNLMPRTLDPIQIKLLENTYKRDIDNHILKLTNEKASIINNIQNEIKKLELQLNNSKSVQNIQNQKHKLELENALKTHQANLNDDIAKFKLEKESEFNKNKIALVNTKKTKWDKELDILKTQMKQKCAIPTPVVTKQPVVTKHPVVTPKQPVVTPKPPVITKQPVGTWRLSTAPKRRSFIPRTRIPPKSQ